MLKNGKSSPFYDHAALVTPSDTVANVFSALYIGGTAGAVKVTTKGGDTVTFSIIATGTFLPVATSLVFSTGTSATPIIGLS